MVDIAYVIAGSDATGVAGIQADLKAFQQLGVYGVGTITCIVSLDPANGWAHRFIPIDPQVIADQFEAAMVTHEPEVVKIGMLGTQPTIDVVARSLRSRAWRHVVVDPVLICKGQEPGAALDTDLALREQVLSLATVITPNLFETKVLAGVDEIVTVDELISAARKIQTLGPRAVVAKGGVDLPGPDAVDVLVDGHDVHVLTVPKVGQARVSGAGCTFAAAITAELAKGAAVVDAARSAKEMVTAAIVDRVASKAPFDSVRVGGPTWPR